MPQFPRLIALCAAFVSLSASAMTRAPDGPHPHQTTIYSPNGACAGFNIKTPTRGTLPFHAQSSDLWVSARNQEVYSIELFNYCHQRVLAVVSVDGMNVVDGSNASVKGRGYILKPGAQALIQGWRKTLDQSAQFYFTPPRDSYGGRTGRTSNLGVIGAAFFFSLTPPVLIEPMRPFSGHSNESKQGVPMPMERSESADSNAPSAPAPAMGASPSSQMAQKSQRLGTGHGDRVHDPVRMGTFERQAHPFSSMIVRYDSYPNLKKRQIIAFEDPMEEQFYFPKPRPHQPHWGQPNPFPNDQPLFTPDPMR